MSLKSDDPVEILRCYDNNVRSCMIGNKSYHRIDSNINDRISCLKLNNQTSHQNFIT